MIERWFRTTSRKAKARGMQSSEVGHTDRRTTGKRARDMPPVARAGVNHKLISSYPTLHQLFSIFELIAEHHQSAQHTGICFR